MLKTDFQDGDCGGHLGFSIGKYFEIRPLAKDEMSFEDFLFFSSGSHLVQWRRTIVAILDFRSTQF